MEQRDDFMVFSGTANLPLAEKLPLTMPIWEVGTVESNLPQNLE